MTAGTGALTDLPSRPTGRILRAAEANAWQDGFGFLEAARKEAEQLQLSAREAYAGEYVQGYQDGKAEGDAEAARLLTETVVKVDRYLAGLEGEVIDIALAVVRQMLGQFDVNVLVANAARHAIGEIRRAKYLKISVHPDALATVQDEVAHLLQDANIEVGVEVNADNMLANDACIVATDIAVIDAGISAQLKAIAAAIAAKTGA